MWTFRHMARRSLAPHCRPSSGSSSVAVAASAAASAAGACLLLSSSETERETEMAPSCCCSYSSFPSRGGRFLPGITTASCEAAAATATVFLPPDVPPPPPQQQQQQQRPSSNVLRRHKTLQMLEEIAKDRDRLPVERLYEVDWREPIGEGAFGTVYAATHRETGARVALKCISKAGGTTVDTSFQREMDAMMRIQEHGGHPGICMMREHLDDHRDDHFYLVLDLVQGGDLFDHLVQHGAYSEADCSRLVRQVASALAFLHGIGCVHVDLKPENVMLSSPARRDSRGRESASVKLVDFGCARLIDENDNNSASTTALGSTPAYCPPEVLRSPGTATVRPSFDLWSLGIIMYITLTGVHPFDAECRATDDEIRDLILAGAGDGSNDREPIVRGSRYTAHLSEDAISVLEGLLEYDPEKRLTAAQLLEDPWILGDTASTNSRPA